jgi:hypothetical protein
MPTALPGLTGLQPAGPALHNSIDKFKCQQHHQAQQHHSLQAQPSALPGLTGPQPAGPALHNSIDKFKCQQHHQAQQNHSLQAQPCNTALINLNANSTTSL